MNEFLEESLFFGAFLTILAYSAGAALKKRFKTALLNPLLIAMVAIIAVLMLFKIDYSTYSRGASYISFFLTPATICLAVPLYRQLSLLKKHAAAIFCGILAGVLTNAVLVLSLSVLLKLDHVQYVTLLPKSITTPIGMGISEELGGMASITAAVIVITGVLGNVMAELLCRIFHLKESAAVGIALGSSSHVVGTAKAMEMGEVQGAISSLSIVVSGLLTVVAAPLFARLY